MVGDHRRQPLARERAERDVGDRGHRLRRIAEGEQRQADDVALKWKRMIWRLPLPSTTLLWSQPSRTMNSSRGDCSSPMTTAPRR